MKAFILAILASVATAAPLPFELRHPMRPGVAEAFRDNPTSKEQQNPENRIFWRNDRYRRTQYTTFTCRFGTNVHCDDPDCDRCCGCVYEPADPKPAK